jgi:hypothetical protein
MAWREGDRGTDYSQMLVKAGKHVKAANEVCACVPLSSSSPPLFPLLSQLSVPLFALPPCPSLLPPDAVGHGGVQAGADVLHSWKNVSKGPVHRETIHVSNRVGLSAPIVMGGHDEALSSSVPQQACPLHAGWVTPADDMPTVEEHRKGHSKMCSSSFEADANVEEEIR